MATKPNGVILWQGASLIDGAPIVAIAVGLNHKSTNRKTGAMVQTYILRSRIDPINAVRTGRDVSICGDCKFRGPLKRGKGRRCYVNIGQGPSAVYRAYVAGKYPKVQCADDIREVGRGRLIRLGTYGDPAAVPAYVWLYLVQLCKGRTGYSHQWRTFPELATLCMASVDTVDEMREAQALGWRTFRTDTTRVIGAQPGEVLCPASKEAGKKLTCAQCLACGGADGRRGTIYIPAHGGSAVMSNIRKLAF